MYDTIDCSMNCARYLVSEHMVKAMLPTIGIYLLALRLSVSVLTCLRERCAI